MRFGIVICLCVWAAAPVHAGLYYSGEKFAELPAQWSGFLLDHRALRNVARPDGATGETSSLRPRYQQEAERLLKEPTLSADELADLGALLIRLGRVDEAVARLRTAQQAHPSHFMIAANLGSAYQMQGNWGAAASTLQDAVRLAPGKWLAVEELHLKLVRQRLRQKTPGQELDDLFEVRYPAIGSVAPGKWTEVELKKLPTRAVAHVQQLALAFPADGPLLWQLAELANVHGDVRSAAAMLEGCVVQFGMGGPELRRRRQWLKEAAGSLPRADQAAHQAGHTGTLAFRSRRALLSTFGNLLLPPISATGVNQIPWELLSSTEFEGKFPPRFPKYLEELKGKQISLTGFMQPLRDDAELTAFVLIAYPVGCWYCEMPELTGMLYVELPAGEGVAYQRGIVRVTGRLSLNSNDPEDFLYTLRNARVGPVD
jgi:hypothetical protein